MHKGFCLLARLSKEEKTFDEPANEAKLLSFMESSIVLLHHEEQHSDATASTSPLADRWGNPEHSKL